MWVTCGFICSPYRFYCILGKDMKVIQNQAGALNLLTASFLVYLEFYQLMFMLDVTEQFWFIFNLATFA